MAAPPPDQCRFCASRECYFRVCTRDRAFDEVACDAHGQDLADLVNAHTKRCVGSVKFLGWNCLSRCPDSRLCRGTDVDDTFSVLLDDYEGDEGEDE